jgi:hypothetical protein
MFRLVLLGLLLFLLGMVLAIVAGVRAARRPRGTDPKSTPKTKRYSSLVVALLLMIVIGPGTCAVGCTAIFLPELWLPSVARHGDELVAAIQKYTTEVGRPPDGISQLVPKYLASLPSTGYMGDSSWEYRTEGMHWQLCVPINELVIDFNEFRYDPSGSTEVPPGFKRVIRHGDWLYMDE